ncbi:Imm45 family immunity protein [Agrobacterium sp. NPDC089420]|uniref:Imm45 family immunity protein n=1 Tax=Agrobacterium sp. NPDC089420 TaxID=3363918 RepID=UPI00384FE354
MNTAYEAVVDFMLVEMTEAERPLEIMVATGYNTGLSLVYLPHEALLKGTRMLSTARLKQNWEKWVYGLLPVYRTRG